MGLGYFLPKKIWITTQVFQLLDSKVRVAKLSRRWSLNQTFPCSNLSPVKIPFSNLHSSFVIVSCNWMLERWTANNWAEPFSLVYPKFEFLLRDLSTNWPAFGVYVIISSDQFVKRYNGKKNQILVRQEKRVPLIC